MSDETLGGMFYRSADGRGWRARPIDPEDWRRARQQNLLGQLSRDLGTAAASLRSARQPGPDARYKAAVAEAKAEWNRAQIRKEIEAEQRRERVRQLTGFPTFGAQMAAILKCRRDSSPPDTRLKRAPTGASETAPQTGGFLVQSAYAQQLVGLMFEKARVAQLCTPLPSGNLADLKVPAIDETSRADGCRFGGGLSYWLAEADTLTATLPRYRQLQFAAKKIVCIVYGTNELEDVSMLGAWLMRVASAELAFQLDRAIISGSAGRPVGILNSGCLITVDKGISTSGTITEANVNDMVARLPLKSLDGTTTRWLAHADTLKQFAAFTGSWSYIPRMAAGNPQPLLGGYPVVVMEQCSPVGTVGDLILGDFSHYLLMSGGVKPTISADVAFLSDQTVFRFTLRVDGMPEFASPVTPLNGTNQQSPFVALASR